MEIRTARGRLFLLLMCIIAFPFLQHSLPFIESGKLKGAVVLAPDVTFSWEKWWEGVYQNKKNVYLNDNTGCRPDLVRLNNQVDFLLFDLLHANGVVIGKDEYLYEKFYIDEYCGLDYMGEDVIRNMIVKLKKVQDTLSKLGKNFVFIYAPSKAWYFPDKFPRGMDRKAIGNATNYKTFKRIGDSVGLNQVDFNAWFLGMKDTAKHMLFSRLGTHWTVYGSLIACDSVIGYMERVKNIKMPELQWQEINRDEKPIRTDGDLEHGLNLISHFKKEVFSYPVYSYNYEGAREKPKVIYIGDSFLWTFLDNGLMQNVSTDWQVWYYFNVAWTNNALSGLEPAKQIDEINWQNELVNADFVVQLYTPANFKGFTYGGSFIEKAYLHFYPDVK